jgi:hypothetical protein
MAMTSVRDKRADYYVLVLGAKGATNLTALGHSSRSFKTGWQGRRPARWMRCEVTLWCGGTDRVAVVDGLCPMQACP